jgi:hypothetical protein
LLSKDVKIRHSYTETGFGFDQGQVEGSQRGARTMEAEKL